jgi:L-ascorbate metabolism protein UlaG (beta-lactamase superfamily)
LMKPILFVTFLVLLVQKSFACRPPVVVAGNTVAGTKCAVWFLHTQTGLEGGSFGDYFGAVSPSRQSFWAKKLISRPFFMNRKIWGKRPAGSRRQRILASPNAVKGIFQNELPTSLNPNKVPMFKMVREAASRPKSVRPSRVMPTVKTDLAQLRTSDTPTVVWFGHSSYLITAGGFTVLVDPVFSGNISPIGAFGRAFAGADAYTVADLPPIDLLVITHDHYDHLDYKTIRELAGHVSRIVTPLGVGAHLEYWGLDTGRIAELDWWESTVVTPEVKLTATPARHFSGRTLKRGQTLWASFVLEIAGTKIFIGGDSGYGPHFKTIGERFGPFNLALLECGQYNTSWPQIHMMPEETAQAAQDLGTTVLLPVHWAKFVLANHPWNEPVRRLHAAVQASGLPLALPQIGQPYKIGSGALKSEWWDFE